MSKPLSDSRPLWTVNVPLEDLVALQNLPEYARKLEAENAQLRREIEGLRRIQSETLQVLGDLRRTIKK